MMNNIFQQANNNNMGNSGGLFSGNNNQGQKSMFSLGTNNSGSKPTNQSLFGQSGINNNPGQGLGNGLFGGMPNPQNNTMLQNNTNNLPNNQPNNLFGNAGIQQPQTKSDMFKFNTPVKGGNNTTTSTLFGNQQPVVNNNGNNSNNQNTFGSYGMNGNQQQTNSLGMAPSNQQQGGGIFGNTNNSFLNKNQTSTNSLFPSNTNNLGNNINQTSMSNEKGTFHIQFNPMAIKEKNEKGHESIMRFMMIASDKSMDELRYEDYQLKKSGKTVTNTGIGQVFNQSNSNFQQQSNTTSGLFPSTSNTGVFQTTNNSSNNNLQTNTGGMLSNQLGFSFGNPSNNNNMNNPQQQQPQQSTLLFNQNSNNTNQQLGTGQFNFNTNQQQPQQNGTLINTTNSVQQPSNSIFPSNVNQQNQQNQTNPFPNNQGSLFSTNSTNTNTSNQQGGGLFTKAQPSLFGTNPGNQTATTSSNTTQSMFGALPTENKTQTQGTLFPSGNTNQTNSTSLFPGTSTAQTTTSTDHPVSLFGNPSTSTSGLFSNVTPTNPTPLSTGPSNNPQQVQMIPAPSNFLGININSVSDCVKNAVLESKNIKDFINEVEQEFSEDKYSDYYKYKSRYSHNARSSYNYDLTPPEDDYYSRYLHSYDKDRKNTNRERMGDYDYYANMPLNRAYYKESTFRQENNFIQNKRMSSFYEQKSENNNYDYNRNIIELNQKANYEKFNTKKRRLENGEEYNKLSKYFYDENIEENVQKNEKSWAPQVNEQEKVIKITLELKNENLTIVVPVNTNNQVLMLKDLIAEKLILKDKSKFKRVTSQNITLMKSNSLMKDVKLLSYYDLKNNDKILVTLSFKFDDEAELNENLHKIALGGLCNTEHKKGRKILSKNSVSNSKYPPCEDIPVLNKAGYYTEPDYKIICRMTTEEIKNVPNFSIRNSNGYIQWNETVDLTKLDLNDIVEIGDCYVQLYKKKTKKPPRGEGLNKHLTITMKVVPREDEDLTDEAQKEEFLQNVHNYVDKLKGDFIGYNEEKQELTFSCYEINDLK